MHFGRLAALALAATLGGAAPGWATAMYTPYTPALNVNISILYCQLRNVGPTSMQVVIDHLGYDNEVVHTATRTLAPGQASSEPGPQGIGTACRFDVKGSTKNVRAIAVYWDGLNHRLILPAR